MSNKTCYYHPSRYIVDFCELCDKPICKDCKMVYKETNDSEYSVEYIYCPVCYHKTIISSTTKESKADLCYMIPFLSVFVILGARILYDALFSFNDHSFEPQSIIILLVGIVVTSIPIFAIFAVIYSTFVTNPKKAKKSELELKLFLDETGVADNITFEKSAYYRNSYKRLVGTRYCNQCGSALELGDSFCEVCGDSTRDEGL